MPRVSVEESIRTLVNHAWDEEVRWPEVEEWARNFQGLVLREDDEQLHALFSLSRFMYFSRRMMREMLRALYRDYFESPLIQRIRRNFGNTKDSILLRRLYNEALQATRFIGVGNPAESGAHLLYFFRQVNYLKKDLFVDLSGAFTPKAVRNGTTAEVEYVPRQPDVSRYVFFDDLVGSGSQIDTYLSGQLRDIRKTNPHVELRFMCLFATSAALDFLNSEAMFAGNAVCLFEMDETYKAFSEDSRYFLSTPEWFSKEKFSQVAGYYGKKVRPGIPLGYRDCQMMIGFSHNTPDNTLPIFWDEGHGEPWSPIFVRYNKVY